MLDPSVLFSDYLKNTPARAFTEDIRKLKQLSVYPDIIDSERVNFYVEPITIEYYIPKESRFATDIKYLFIELFDPLPMNDKQQKIFTYFQEINEPIDLIKVMDEFPMHMGYLLQHYTPLMNIFEALSQLYRSGLEEDKLDIRKALYINEALRKKEPSLPSLEVLGDHINYNINWCVRFLNRNKIFHTLEDKTVAHLITLHKQEYIRLKRPITERFTILSDIYFEQAFPYSSMSESEIAEFKKNYT